MQVDFSKFSMAGFNRGASFLKECGWRLASSLFFMPSVPMPSAWRVGLLRFFGAKIGAGVVIRSGVHIHFPWRLRVGDHVWLGEECWLLNLEQIVIGNNVCISQRAFLCTGSHDYKSRSFDLIVKPITVEDGAWLAAGCWVGPGVKVGSHAVLAAGSVASGDLEPFGIYRGNPAVSTKSRVISTTATSSAPA